MIMDRQGHKASWPHPRWLTLDSSTIDEPPGEQATLRGGVTAVDQLGWPARSHRDPRTGATMKVGEVVKAKGTGVITVGPGEAVWSVLRRFRLHKIGALVVVDDDGQLLGLLGERDLVNGLISYGKGLLDRQVRDVMSTHVPTCDPDDAVGKVIHTMTDRRARHLPVIDDGKLIGVISIGDVVKAALDDVELEVNVLRDIAKTRR